MACDTSTLMILRGRLLFAMEEYKLRYRWFWHLRRKGEREDEGFPFLDLHLSFRLTKSRFNYLCKGNFVICG